MNARKKPVRVIPFAEIERRFQVAGASYWWFDGRYCPAVTRDDNGDYRIRFVASVTVNGAATNTQFGYFVLEPDGTVLVAPRGYARDYKPGLVTGLDEAVAKYAEPSSDAPRFRL